jgi:hypothetical protein
MGGVPPLGYAVRERKLVVIPDEARSMPIREQGFWGLIEGPA